MNHAGQHRLVYTMYVDLQSRYGEEVCVQHGPRQQEQMGDHTTVEMPS